MVGMAHRPLWDCNRKGGKREHWGSDALFKLMIKKQCDKRKEAMTKEEIKEVKDEKGLCVWATL